MKRLHKHPDPAVEEMLQKLEHEGVDPKVIDRFVREALERQERKLELACKLLSGGSAR